MKQHKWHKEIGIFILQTFLFALAYMISGLIFWHYLCVSSIIIMACYIVSK
jgi:hypothetical protein